MKLSFVIPTRNQARFIERTLDSCRAQRIPDAEILVIDGASTDGTRRLLAAQGSDVRWLSEPDRGQADAVNKGVALATGDVIAWINSDDFYVNENAVRIALTAFEGDVDLVHGNGVAVDAAGHFLRRYRGRPVQSARELLLAPISVCQPATLFRKRLFEQVGGMRTDLHYALDYELFLRMFEAARRVRHVPRTLACMTYHADAKSVAGIRRHLREIRQVKREAARRGNLSTAEHVRLWSAMAPLYVYWAAVRLGLWRVS